MLMKKRMLIEYNFKTLFSKITSCLVCVLITVLITIMLPASEAIGITALCILFFLLIFQKKQCDEKINLKLQIVFQKK